MLRNLLTLSRLARQLQYIRAFNSLTSSIGQWSRRNANQQLVQRETFHVDSFVLQCKAVSTFEFAMKSYLGSVCLLLLIFSISADLSRFYIGGEDVYEDYYYYQEDGIGGQDDDDSKD